MLPILIGAGLIILGSLLQQRGSLEGFQSSTATSDETRQAALLREYRQEAVKILGEFAAFKSTNATEYGKLTAAQQQVTESARAALQGFVAATTADITAARIAEIKQKLGDIDGLISSVRLSINGLRDVTQRPSMTAQQLEALRVQTLAKIDMILGVLNSQKVKDDTDPVKNPKNTEGAKMVDNIKQDLVATQGDLLNSMVIPADYDSTNYSATQRAVLRNQILLTASEVEALERAAKLYLYKLLGQNDSYEHLFRMSSDDYERTFFSSGSGGSGGSTSGSTPSTQQAQPTQATTTTPPSPAVAVTSLSDPPATDFAKPLSDSITMNQYFNTLTDTVRYVTTLTMKAEQSIVSPTGQAAIDLVTYQKSELAMISELLRILPKFTADVTTVNTYINALQQYQAVRVLNAVTDPNYPPLTPIESVYNTAVAKYMAAKAQTPQPDLAQQKTNLVTARNALSLGLAPYQTTSNQFIKAHTDIYLAEIQKIYEAFANPPRTFENFQSMGNPYNQASPSVQQMYEFRLGKRMLVNQIGAYAK